MVSIKVAFVESEQTTAAALLNGYVPEVESRLLVRVDTLFRRPPHRS